MQGCSYVQSLLGSQSALIDWESTAVLRNSQLFSHFQFDRKKNLRQPFSGSFSRKQWGEWEGSSQEEDTKLTILLTCLMKSQAVSGQKIEKPTKKNKKNKPQNQTKNPTKKPNKPHNPTPLLERRATNSCPGEDPIERPFKKAYFCS